MGITLVNLRYRADLGGFDSAELEHAAAQRSRRSTGELLDVREHLYEVGGVPHLCVVLVEDANDAGDRPSGGPRSRRAEPPPIDERDRALYERLRAWRRAKAIAGGVPPYRVLTNRQLAAVAAAKPVTLDALGALEGIGRTTVEQHGAEIAAEVAAHAGAPDARSSGAG
jgi:superfamily II DNA helicase RecQ